jgi:hypothetical protein
MTSQKQQLNTVLYIMLLVSAVVALAAWFPYFRAMEDMKALLDERAVLSVHKFGLPARHDMTPLHADGSAAAGVECRIEPEVMELRLAPWNEMEARGIAIQIRNNSDRTLRINCGSPGSFGIAAANGTREVRNYSGQRDEKVFEIPPRGAHVEKAKIAFVRDGDGRYVWAFAFGMPTALIMREGDREGGVIFKVSFADGTTLKTGVLKLHLISKEDNKPRISED